MAAIDPDLETAYLGGQARPTWPGLLARMAEASAAVLAGASVARDVAYGPHPRQVVDLVQAEERARAVVLYLHAGYWQARDKAAFACLAPAFARLGAVTALANYPLCPEATVAALTEAVRAVVPLLAERYPGLPIVASGHSAGAHLAVELAMTDWSERGLERSPVVAVIGLSGVYDLTPLTATSLNLKLGLDAAQARAASPVFRVGALGCPALFAVGGGETPAFRDQTRRMAAAWAAAGHPAATEIVAGADHFSLLDALASASGALPTAVASMLDRVA